MSTADLVASTVMDASASLLNDTGQSVYTYTAQIPYLRIAMNELQEKFELNSISSTEVTSEYVTLIAGQTEITFGGTPALPDDLIEPQQLWERNSGIDPYIPMTRREYLPHDLDGAPTSQFVFWVWNQQKIIMLPSTSDNDIKIDYIATLFPELVDQNSQINIINAETYLEYRTAALCAEFIERNVSSANSLNAYASLAMDRVLGIGAKSKQTLQSVRRPFRSGWKRRGNWWR